MSQTLTVGPGEALKKGGKGCCDTTKAFLYRRTKMFAIFMGFPAIISFILAMIVSVIYHVTYGSYKVCPTISTDSLNQYLYGCIIGYTALPLCTTVQ
jgi:hypothetical protein